MTDDQDQKIQYDYRHFLEQIIGICEQFSIDSLVPQTTVLGELLLEDDIFNVALLGGFKAGKSSLLNSMIGRNVLPVAVIPLTAIITRIKYGRKDRAVVCFLTGREEEIPFDCITDYVAEQHNPNNVKQVQRVDIEVPELNFCPEIIFVDTPGLGSVFEHNTLISMDWLPRVGEAFLAISADHPLSEEDIRLLKELQQATTEITILLTKADLISPDELNIVLNFIHGQTRDHFEKPIRILPFSVEPGFEPMRDKLRGLLQSFNAVKPEKTNKIIRHKLSALIENCSKYLILAISAAGAEQTSRLQLQEEIQQEFRILSTVRSEIWTMNQNLRANLHSDAANLFQESHTDILEKITTEFHSQIPCWKGHIGKVTADFRQWIEKDLLSHLEAISTTKGEQLATLYLPEALSSSSRIVRAFQDRLSQRIKEALHITFAGAEFDAHIERPESPDIRIGYVFDTDLEFVWFLIPMCIFRPLINRHFLKLLPWEVEKNLYRLSAQWSEAIFRSIEDISKQAKSFMEDELTTIANLLSQTDNSLSDLENAFSLLEEIESELGSI
ncbi:MAG: dynamin family protein [Deltaproteobacteria bacterium]|nr:dynamin family protein [Deltaproteobacteria bacterium]